MRALLACALIAGVACSSDAGTGRTFVPGSPSIAGGPASAPPSRLEDPPFVPSATASTPQPSAAPARAAPQFSEPPPEHTGVTFDWTETDPTRLSVCKAGHYVGAYMCRLFILRTEGEGAFDVSGTVDLQLEPTTDGEFLRVRNGKFSSATLAAIPVEAEVAGELDCSASKFEGRLENGTFSVALGLPVPFTQGTFSGPLIADYDGSTAALSGTWNMTGELDGFPGSCMNGSWSAKWLE